MYVSIYALSFFISQSKRAEYDKLDFYHTFITMTAEHSHDNNVNSLKICSDGKLFKCAHQTPTIKRGWWDGNTPFLRNLRQHEAQGRCKWLGMKEKAKKEKIIKGIRAQDKPHGGRKRTNVTDMQ